MLPSLMRSSALRFSMTRPAIALTGASSIQARTFSLSAPTNKRLAMTAQEELDKWNANNKKFNRPLSPHLSIYEWSIPMTMSAFYRIWAVMLGVIFVGAPVAYAAAHFGLGFSDPAAALSATASAARGSGLVMMGVWLAIKANFVVPLVYHCVNGCRHLGWDQYAYGIRHLDQIYKSGNIVIVVTAVLAGALTLMHFD